MNKNQAILYIVSTPIGNLEDITHRALQVLGMVDVLACEDTRQTRKIFSRYDIPFPKIFFSYHEHNEEAAGQKILRLLEQGKDIALCTDAGTPGISDPGYRIISECMLKGFRLEIIPGPSAVTSALLASGLPTSSFTFKGFPPRKKGPRQKFFALEKELPHTLIFFESPQRLESFLADALDVLGNRRAAVCIDLSKMYEEVQKGYLAELYRQFAGKKPKGEVTIVIAGNHPKFIASVA
jgi:16S rRNA (cytidine1402-2'-O)-methyltransferase